MVDEMMNQDYLQLYGDMGSAFSEIIDEAPYEMAVLSNLMIYLTKVLGEKKGEESEWTSEKL